MGHQNPRDPYINIMNVVWELLPRANWVKGIVIPGTRFLSLRVPPCYANVEQILNQLDLDMQPTRVDERVICSARSIQEGWDLRTG